MSPPCLSKPLGLQQPVHCESAYSCSQALKSHWLLYTYTTRLEAGKLCTLGLMKLPDGVKSLLSSASPHTDETGWNMKLRKCTDVGCQHTKGQPCLERKACRCLGCADLRFSKHILQVPHFPFPTPPKSEALLAAQKCLVALSALHPASHPSTPLGLTPLGRAMSHYPITPRHARMLLQVCWPCLTTQH